MEIKILHLLEGAKLAKGLVVIIDVFRAFSTACYIVRNGAVEIIAVGEVAEAYKLKEENSDFILIGERGGRMLSGFDFGNSPTEIQTIDFSGKTIIQTTSSGTQGLTKALLADEVITGSFVNAEAIVAYIKKMSPPTVTLVAMGTMAVKPNLEDTLCAQYIADRLSNVKVDTEGIYNQLRNSEAAQIFFDPQAIWAPEMDFELCAEIGLCDFVLRAEKNDKNMLLLKPLHLSLGAAVQFRQD